MSEQEFKKINKCPKCGQEIDSMTTSCPWCGCQINYKEAVSSITTFNQELQKIDAEKIQAIEANDREFQEQINKAWREKKKEELGNQEMSDEETAYYIDTNAKIQKILLDIQ